MKLMGLKNPQSPRNYLVPWMILANPPKKRRCFLSHRGITLTVAQIKAARLLLNLARVRHTKHTTCGIMAHRISQRLSVMPQDLARAQAMRNTSIVGALVNALLTVIKIIFGVITQSHALIADGIHSLADLSTDAMVWFAARFTAMPADKDHPYGHARIETAFTVILALILGVTALGIAM